MTLSRREFTRWLAGAVAVPGAAGELLASSPVRPAPTTGRRGPSAAPAPGWPGYDQAMVIDCLASPGAFNVPGAGGGLGEGALDAARASGITAVNLTIGVVGDAPDAFERTVKDLARWEGVVADHPEVFARVRSVADVRAAKAAGRVGLIYGFQDTTALEADLGRLDAFYHLGVRIIQLTYNGRNRVGDGSLEPGNAGISRFGATLVERMNELGILVDLSHCGQRTTAEGIALSKAPPAVTHSGCDAVFRHPRNKRDQELRALADKGGVVGIYLMPYLNASGPPTADDVIRHIEHALQVCGEDHVGIGSDNSIQPVDDNEDYRRRLKETVQDRMRRGISAPREETAPFVPELNSPRRMELIADRLTTRGHPHRVVEKVLGANWLRLFTEVWTQPRL